jgi:hypothetical protein
MTEDQPRYAVIHVQDGNNHAWPIVERTRGGWQSGAHHYPDRDVRKVAPLTLIDPETLAHYTQVENALRAICDAAIRDTTIGFDCLDSIYINEARALLDSGATPTGPETSD